MKQYKVIIADSSEEFQAALKARLLPFCQVRCCSTGWQALSLLSEEMPDVLVLDLMLPELDGISLLRALEADGCCPVIAATTCYVSPYILKAAEQLQVRCLLEKPCSLDAAEEKIRGLLQNRPMTGGDLSGRVSGLLLALSFSPKLRGYGYLREAVVCLCAHRGICIIKDLYPRVGRAFGVSAEDVEHSIRGAVLLAWKHRREGIWEQYFGKTAGEKLERPTNAALIQMLERTLEAEGLTEEQALSHAQ